MYIFNASATSLLNYILYSLMCKIQLIVLSVSPAIFTTIILAWYFLIGCWAVSFVAFWLAHVRRVWERKLFSQMEQSFRQCSRNLQLFSLLKCCQVSGSDAINFQMFWCVIRIYCFIFILSMHVVNLLTKNICISN